MIELARAQGKTVLVDPKGDDYSKYVGATLVTPNRAEFRDVAGSWKTEEEFARKAQALREKLKLQALLVTLGEDGMKLYEAGGVRHEKARAREVFDVSGAGDTVIATLGVMLGAGMPLEEAVRVSNVAAGIKVLKFGTAVVQPKELRDALAQG
jgi:rfaE bifunctional protein kinase chain/domain